MFLTIIEDDAPFTWSPPLEDGTPSETTFQLRMVSDEVHERLQREHTKKAKDEASRAMVPKTNWTALSQALLDYAIVDWSGLHGSASGQDVPCTSAMKARLPEKIKTEIIRLCVAKEGGELAAATEEKKRSATISSGNPTI